MQSISPYNEGQLLLQVAAGNETAFAALVDRFWKNVYLHALAYTRSPQRAEEVTQDVFLHVWHKRHVLREVEQFAAWLHVVARNSIINAMRKKLIQLAHWEAAEQESPDLLETLLVPDRQMEYREAYQLLLKGIQLLPEKRREVFTMSRIEGRSNPEIAAILDIHPVTVSQYLAKSLVFLRTYLAENQLDAIQIIILLAASTAS